MSTPRPVGAHVSVAGGPRSIVERGDERACQALQLFPSNPRGWKLPEPDPAGDDDVRSATEERGWPLYLHAPYLVNLASPDATTRQRSARTLEFALERGARLGADAVVVHAGHARGSPRPEALAHAAAALRTLLERHTDVDLAVEPTAGARGAIAGRPEEMLELLEAVDGHPRLGFCLDTCHLWAAGVDYRDRRGAETLRAQLRELGPERIRVVHLNDSKDECGAARDRHENLGEGRIGVEAIRALVCSEELAHAPLVTETPGTAADQRRDVELARSWDAADSRGRTSRRRSRR